MEFTIFDLKSFNHPNETFSGSRWLVQETNYKHVSRRFASLRQAKEWLIKQGFVFKPRLACWVQQ
jgi:hypothetical protein